MFANGSLSQNYTNFLLNSVSGLRFPYFMNFMKFLGNAIFKACRVDNWVIASNITPKNELSAAQTAVISNFTPRLKSRLRLYARVIKPASAEATAIFCDFYNPWATATLARANQKQLNRPI